MSHKKRKYPYYSTFQDARVPLFLKALNPPPHLWIKEHFISLCERTERLIFLLFYINSKVSTSVSRIWSQGFVMDEGG